MSAEPLPIVRTSSGGGPAHFFLVGNPNVGKSVIFGFLTGRYVTVSNYPGTTVEISSGRTAVDGVQVPVLDTPGTHSFIPSSEEERVTPR